MNNLGWEYQSVGRKVLAVEELMEVNMGALEKLKLVALAPKRKKSATNERRDKMVSQLTEQLKVVDAALGDARKTCFCKSVRDATSAWQVSTAAIPRVILQFRRTAWPITLETCLSKN